MPLQSVKSIYPHAYMQNRFSLDEIKGWQTFQHFVGDYFELGLGHTAERSGIGPDAGKDILVTALLNDGVTPVVRKWVVQCKCYESSAVKLLDISKVNIPSLVQRNQANGYLLVCKGEVHNQVREFFSDLNNGSHPLGPSYQVWDGSQLYSNVLLLKPGPFFRKYFPEYQDFLVEEQKQDKEREIEAMIQSYLKHGDGGVK